MFLKKFRENKLKMGQKEFAELIGISQQNLTDYEDSDNEVPLEVLIKIASVTGTTIDELVNYKPVKPKPIKVNNTWENADFTKRSIVNYIEKTANSYREQWGSNYDKYINELRNRVNRVIVKPKIAIVGHSDVGKSRLINTILGSDKMPTSWTPTTSITVYIKHIDDRPSFIKDEAWIFRASLKNKKEGWDEKRLKDEEYCRAWKISSGNAEILRDYGTRQGEMYGEQEAGSAVIFVESDILKDCDVIDLPGFGTGDRLEDDIMTFKAKEYADVLIYMSHAGQFMQGEGIEYLKESINALNVVENVNENTLQPLSNLFIVASQAHTVDNGNKKSLDNILDTGCHRLLKTIPGGFWDNKASISGYKYNHDVIRNRFYTYTTDIEHLRKPFEDDLKILVEKLPKIIDDKAKDFISDYIKSTGVNMDKEIKEYTNIINEKNRYEQLLKEIEKNEPKRANDNQNRRMKMIEDIKIFRDTSISEFADSYGDIISVDKIIDIIKDKGFKKKKEDIQSLVSYINSVLQEEMQGILKSKSKELKKKIDNYVSDFENSIDIDNYANDFPNIEFSFDATRAFASGLVGLATFGGLAVWASALGNLGAYILVAKGVSLLSALGISVGGSAAAASTVAAFGGPVVLGIAIAIIAALSVFALLSGGWQKKIAKKIVKEYDKNNCLIKFKNNIETFWEDTENAFSAAANSLEKEWKDYVNNLKEMISTYDVDDIKNRIKRAKEFKNFIKGIPL
ncbi:MAG: helix-turn-helix domain-containing protein [Halanaerobiales bacterium]